MENLPTIEHVFYGICLSACIILPIWWVAGEIKKIAKSDALLRKRRLECDRRSERAFLKHAMRNGKDGCVIEKPPLVDWGDISLIQKEIEIEKQNNNKKDTMMIKVNVIEKEEKEQILLEDCEINDVVEMNNRCEALVTRNCGAVKDGYKASDKCLVMFFAGRAQLAEYSCLDEGRIKRIIGTLTGIEVTAK